MILHCDFETRSHLIIGGKESVGIDNYAKHPSTEALMLAWAIDEESVDIWFPGTPMPSKLKDSLNDTECLIAAWNSAFERYIFKYVLKRPLPISRFTDPQASARYLSLPASLEECGWILNLPKELQKDERGKELIEIFSNLTTPRIPKQKKDESETEWRNRIVQPYFRDEFTDPEAWEEFVEYCKQDVVAEREITHRLEKVRVFPLPERERKIWLLDQKINDAGMPVDRKFVESMYRVALKAKAKAVAEQVTLSGIEKPNGPKALPWVQERGYPFKSLKKENVQVALDDETVVMTPECREFLIKRRISASTSYTKLAAILRQVSSNNRLCHQFIYMGSSRCGRWSGNAVQLHNMARPDKEFEDLATLAEARKLIKAEDFDAIEKRFGEGQVLRVVKNCIRSVFVAPEGERLNVCDLNAIETRVGAWVSNCGPLLDVFAKKRDPYIDFAMKMTQIPYETLDGWLHGTDKEKKAEAKLHRQVAKPGVLGCVYRLGGGNWYFKKGDKVRGGLWGYAHNMGIKMSQELAHESVRVFREAYREICQFWYDCENAIKKVLKGPRGATEQVGPANCPIIIDKLTITRRGEEGHPILRIKLPSGRYLHYMDAYLDDSIMPWKDAEGGDVYKETFHYSGVNQITHQWEMGVTAHGGKTMENIVQGIARDVLAEVLLRLDALMSLQLIGHVHDEGLGLGDNDPFSPGIEAMLAAFTEPMPWAPTLPLGADGYEASGLTNFYRKG